MALFRFEYVARVVLPIFAVSLSYAVDDVVSAVSMCSQKVSVALLQPDGIVTLWLRLSVCVPPVPSSQAKLEPPWADCPARLVMTVVEDGVQDEVPLSKSPPETTCAGVQAAASGAPAERRRPG